MGLDSTFRWIVKSNCIILDDEAFKKASDDFRSLAEEINRLRNDIQTSLDRLQAGFNTPAGEKFRNSCENNLLKPLDQQKTVIEHVSETLDSVKEMYKSVFDEYEDLNTKINSYQS